ncbi:phage fiber-tail adaptor protein [Paludibaculum fermentans]|uniref:phage fiber-tail adaptor protein n=1 Tax=Paludibaculum fermentans TaxID=1473598 RepID=UPI003EBA3778
MNYFTQADTEKLAYRQSIAGDTITNAAWTITPSATLAPQATTADTATCMVSGLTSGTTYTLTVLMTCGSGQIVERSVTIACV